VTVTTESLSILQCGSSNLNAAHCVFDCVAAPKSFAPHFLLCLLVMPTKSNSQSQPIQHNPSRDSEFQQLCTLSGFKHQVSRCLHRKCNHSLVLTSPMPNYIPPFLTSLTPSLSCSPHNRPSPPFPLLHSLPFNPIHSESSCPMLPCAHCHNLLRHPPQLSHATQQWWFQGQAHPCTVQDVLE
jgi:hypothetical protein